MVDCRVKKRSRLALASSMKGEAHATFSLLPLRSGRHDIVIVDISAGGLLSLSLMLAIFL